MRRLVGLLAGLVLAATLAPAALAAQPGIYRESFVYNGYDSSWSESCGVTVNRSASTTFTIVDMGDAGYDVHVETRQTLTGPGGYVRLVGAYASSADAPFESYVDESTGLYTEVYRETYRGTVTVFVDGLGQVSKRAGWLYATVTMAFPDDSAPIVTVEDRVVHGIQPGDTWGPDTATVCSYLV
jgi:hypothetical protein